MNTKAIRLTKELSENPEFQELIKSLKSKMEAEIEQFIMDNTYLDPSSDSDFKLLQLLAQEFSK